MYPVALVTGAAGGIGVAITSELLEAGFRVAAADLEASLARDSLQQLQAQHGERLSTHALDVRDPRQFQSLVASVASRFDRLDALANVAGIAVPSRLRDLTWQSMQDHLSVNVGGVLFGMQAAIEPLAAGTPGSIVNVASISGRLPSYLLGAYGASKAAVISLTRTAAVEFARLGVRVNAIAPGIVDTDMWGRLDPAIASIVERPEGSIFAAQVRRIPLRRPAKAEDIAPVVRFLLSPASHYITGQTINVDGGFLMS